MLYCLKFSVQHAVVRVQCEECSVHFNVISKQFSLCVVQSDIQKPTNVQTMLVKRILCWVKSLQSFTLFCPESK